MRYEFPETAADARRIIEAEIWARKNNSYDEDGNPLVPLSMFSEDTEGTVEEALRVADKAIDAATRALASARRRLERRERIVELCESHGGIWADFGPIDSGCGWGNPLRPCVKAQGRYALIRED